MEEILNEILKDDIEGDMRLDGICYTSEYGNAMYVAILKGPTYMDDDRDAIRIDGVIHTVDGVAYTDGHIVSAILTDFEIGHGKVVTLQQANLILL
jgi:hypothetical protein